MTSILRALGRRRPSPSMVVALLALVVALGGTSYAAIVVTSANIRNNSIQSVDIRDNSILSRDIRNGSIFPIDLAPGTKNALRGAQGPAGPQGPQGPAGPTGPTGPQGASGASAFAAAKYVSKVTATSVSLVDSQVVATWIDVPVASRLLVYGTLEARSGGDATYGASCRIVHEPFGSSTATTIGPLVSADSGEADVLPTMLPIALQGSVLVEPGGHAVALDCVDSSFTDANIHNAALSVIAVQA